MSQSLIRYNAAIERKRRASLALTIALPSNPKLPDLEREYRQAALECERAYAALIEAEGDNLRLV